MLRNRHTDFHLAEQILSFGRKLLFLAASQTARLFNSADLASPFSLSRPTIREYLAVLEQIFLIEQLQLWHNNLLIRLIKTPKMHMSDSDLACALLGVNSGALWQDKTLLGQLLENPYIKNYANRLIGIMKI